MSGVTHARDQRMANASSKPVGSAKVAIAPSDRDQIREAWTAKAAVDAAQHTLSVQLNDEALRAELGLDQLERLQLVQKAVKALFMPEYAVLIEYTEVVMPVIYTFIDRAGIYMSIMYQPLNREFYPQITDLSLLHLLNNISNVLLYAVLELLSFLVMGFILKRQLGILTTHQLTFVLKMQWRIVQAKFGVWVLYVVQTYLVHSGNSKESRSRWESLYYVLSVNGTVCRCGFANADFSFQFKWLLQQTPAT